MKRTTYRLLLSTLVLGSLPAWAIGILVVVAMSALLVWWARTSSALVRAGLALCLGGALSNALDRLIYPGVADFFSFLSLRPCPSSRSIADSRRSNNTISRELATRLLASMPRKKTVMISLAI